MKKKKIYKLKNGLKIVFYQDNSKHITLASLFVMFGGRNKSILIDGNNFLIPNGMAHFLEHLLIEHSILGNSLVEFKKRHTFSNGYTSNETTEFLINSVVDFEKDLVDLIKMVNIPNYTKDDIEETKKAIRKERMMKEDEKFASLLELEYNCLFHDIKYPNILGEISDIDSINYENTKMCYDAFYRPSNQVLIISGNFNMKKIKKLIEDTYKEISFNLFQYQLPKLNEKNTVLKKEGFIEKDVHVDYVRLSYKIDVSNIIGKDLVKLDFYMDYFLSYLFDSSSDIYNSLVKDNVCVYNINFFSMKEENYYIVKIGTATNKHDEFIKRIKEAMNKKEVNEEDFEIRRKQSILNLVLREDNLSDTMIPFIDNIIKYGYDDIDTISDMEEQAFDEYKNMIESLDFSNFVIAKMIRKEKND